MNLRSLQNLFILLLAFSLPVAGSTPPEIKISERSEVAFRFRPGSNNHLNNHFVKEIARYNFFNLYTTEYTLDFELKVTISESNRGEYTLKARVSDPSLKGDIFYKDFDLSEVLLPSDFEFDLLIKGDPKPLNLRFDRMKLDRENVVQLEQNAIPDFEYPEFSVANIAFIYDDADRDVFSDRIAEINRYLAYFEMLGFNLEKAGKINPDTKDSILPVFVQIYDIDRFNDEIGRMQPGFPIPVFYQEKMKEKKKKLDAYRRRLQTLFTRNIDTLKPKFDGSQLEAAAEMLVRLQKVYLSAMRKTHHLYEPAYLEVVDFFGQGEGWQSISARLKDELPTEGSMHDHTETIKGFTTILYRAYTRACDSLIAQEAFNEAELFAIQAKTFCELSTNPGCEILTFNRLSQTKYGIFDAYLRVAQTAMDNKNLPYSYQYLKLAQDFQSRNSRFIISQAAVKRSLEQLAWECLDHAESLYDTEEYAGAVKNYSMSREIYVDLAVGHYLSLIDKKIDRCATAIEAAQDSAD